MSTEYFTASGNPSQGAQLASAAIRSEYLLVEAGFAKFPAMSTNQGKVMAVNAGGTSIEAVATTGTGNIVKSASPTFTGTIIAAAMTLSGLLTAPSPTFTGTITAAAANFSGALVGAGGVYATGSSGIPAIGTAAIALISDRIAFNRAASAADNRRWDVILGATSLSIRAIDDANATAGVVMAASRSGTTITTVELGGNVGIGVSPSYRLDVKGGAGSAVPAQRWEVDGGSLIFVEIEREFGGAGTAVFGTQSNHNLAFKTNDTSWLQLNTNGSVEFASYIGVKGDPISSAAIAVYNTGTGFGAIWVVADAANGEASIGYRDTGDSNSQVWVVGKNVGGTDDAFFWYRSSVQMKLTTTGELRVGDGSAASPSISFLNETDCGMYKSGTNEISLATAGLQRMVIDASGHLLMSITGTAGAPTYSFVTDPDCGMYSSGTNEISWATAGTKFLTLTSDGRLYGTALHNNAGAVTGTTNQYIASGTYTPTATHVLNVAASTMRVSQWIRVGNAVMVSGTCQIDPTAAGGAATQIRLSLPIASTLSATNKLGGTGVSAGVANQAIQIYADTAGNDALLYYLSDTTTVTEVSFTFMYLLS